MDADTLQKGSKYKIKDSVSLKVCTRPMEYVGTQTYRGVVYHDFWDKVLRLGHWLNPDDVEPA